MCDASANRHDLDVLAKKYLDIKTTHFEDIAGKGAKQLTFNQIELTAAADYAAEDADVALQLHNQLSRIVGAEPALEKVYREIEMPLLGVLSSIERNGVFVDADLLKVQGDEIANKIKAIEALAHEDAGQEFNLGSSSRLVSCYTK